MRLNFYIDGFNFYYGSLKGTNFRWLNIHKFCRLSFPGDAVNHVNYFTARVKNRPNPPGQAQRLTTFQRQATYLRALETLQDVTIYEGHFLESHVPMRLVHPPANGPRSALVFKSEEKGSDVNIALA